MSFDPINTFGDDVMWCARRSTHGVLLKRGLRELLLFKAITELLLFKAITSSNRIADKKQQRVPKYPKKSCTRNFGRRGIENVGCLEDVCLSAKYTLKIQEMS